MAKKVKKVARREYTKADVKELRAHSKAKTPVARIVKLTKRTEGSLRQKARTLGYQLGASAVGKRATKADRELTNRLRPRAEAGVTVKSKMTQSDFHSESFAATSLHPASSRTIPNSRALITAKICGKKDSLRHRR
jgi:hypothetical protein